MRDFLDNVNDGAVKIGWCLLILICGFFLFVCAKAQWSAPKTERQLKSAVWVEDGAVHPENEGKLVAVVFHPEAWTDASDTDMDLPFNCPVVRRTVQKLNWDGTRYLWQTVGTDSEDWLKNAVFTGTPQGENAFTIDPQLLVSLNTPVECGESDFTQEALQRLTASVDEVYYSEYLWFSEAPYACMDDLGKDADADDIEDYKPYEGARRIRYNVMDVSSAESLVIVGYQQGSTLVKADDLDAMSVYENVKSLNELVRTQKTYLSLGIFLVGAVCLGLLALAVKKIRE